MSTSGIDNFTLSSRRIATAEEWAQDFVSRHERGNRNCGACSRFEFAESLFPRASHAAACGGVIHVEYFEDEEEQAGINFVCDECRKVQTASGLGPGLVFRIAQRRKELRP